jgi:hypothetical protein
MEVSGQIHAPAALPPGKEYLVPTGYEAGWREKNSQPLLGLEPLITQPVAQRFTTSFEYGINSNLSVTYMKCH